jgi:aspartyl aminopeptidase
MSSYSRHLPLAEKACSFLSASTDPYHAVKNAVLSLEAAGFRPAYSATTLVPGEKYFYTVHHSTLVAFTVGKQWNGTGRFKILGGHTDSPILKVKPRSNVPSKNGVVQLGVECYGGGLWHTWFDRDLSISGKVLVRNASDRIETRLVQLKDPIARVSTLCIHLQSAEERAAFTVNKQDHTVPIVGMSNEELVESITKQLNDPWQQGQEPLLLQRIASQLGVDVQQIADWDLNLYDSQAAAIGGLHQEFLYSARLDNLATCFCAIEALTEHSKNLEADADISMICLFDHEEVGSVSTHGAGSPVLQQAVQRVLQQVDSTTHLDVLAKSFCLSVDQAHAIHPNYASKHEAQHSPKLNAGVVIKTNSNQRYTTNSLTGFVVRELARLAKTPIQEFCGTFTLVLEVSCVSLVSLLRLSCSPQRLSMWQYNRTNDCSPYRNSNGGLWHASAFDALVSRSYGRR